MTADPISIENMYRQAAHFNRTQKKVLWLYMRGFTGTADQAGQRLGLEPLQIRPRCTMLVKLGFLEKWRIIPTGRHSSSWILRLRTTEREPTLPLDDGQPTEADEWRDYDPDC